MLRSFEFRLFRALDFLVDLKSRRSHVSDFPESRILKANSRFSINIKGLVKPRPGENFSTFSLGNPLSPR